MNKVEYVKRQDQTRNHTCHWPGCEKQVPPAMWGCKTHWFTLPQSLRARIWTTYKPGQEITMTPSAAYTEAARAVQKWILDYLLEVDGGVHAEGCHRAEDGDCEVCNGIDAIQRADLERHLRKVSIENN